MTKHLRFLFIALLMAVWTGGWAQTTVTFTASSDKSSTATLTKDGVTLTILQGTANSIGKLGNGTDYRIYAKNKFSVSSSVGNITKIVFNCNAENTSKKGPGNLNNPTTGKYSYSGKIGTWTSSTATNTVTFNTSQQVQATKIVVTVAPAKTSTTTKFGDNYSKKTFTFVNGVLEDFTAPQATVTPAEAQSAMEYWSDNENVVTVGTDGTLSFGTVFDTEAKIYAGIKDGNATYEASSDYYTVINTSNLKDPELAFNPATIDFDVNNIEFKSADHLNNPYKVAVKYSINPTSTNATINENTGVAEIYEPGEYTITATFAGDDTYQSANATFILNAKDMRQDATLAFDAESYNIDVNYGKFLSADHLKNPNTVAVKYAIVPASENVEITANGEVTVLATGEYTITATFAGNNTYKPATATCKLVVTDGIIETKTVTFVAGVDKGSTKDMSDDSMKKEFVTISSTSAAFAYDADYRFYGSNTTHTFSTKVGTITKIEFFNTDDTYNLTRLQLKDNKNGKYESTKTSATWTGSAKEVIFITTAQVRATKIIVTLAVPQAKAYTFDETNDNNIVENYENANVTLKRSNLVTDNWNTFCVPFAISAEDIATTWGEGTLLRTFDSMSGTSTMKFKSAESIEAGKPYLVKPAKETTGDLTFNGVQTVVITKAENTVGENGFYMVGTYNAIKLKEDGSNLFLTTENKFNRPIIGKAKMKGMRVYFEVPTNTEPAALRANIDGVETGINAINGIEGNATAPVYNLQGQCVGNSLRSLAPGIYVQGGKKYVVK